jgi:hypothetical protein
MDLVRDRLGGENFPPPIFIFVNDEEEQVYG